MAKFDNAILEKYGITGATEVVYNPSYEELFEEEMKPGLTGYDKGQLTELGAVNVMTGVYTGRSPKDKFIVVDENSKDTVWWTTDAYKNDNHPASPETWAAVLDLAKKELSNKKLYVVDGFCGANKDTRMKGGGLAGPLRDQHVYPSCQRRGARTGARLRCVQRFQGQGDQLQGARFELRDRCSVQRYQPRAGNHQHMVWW